VPTRSTHAAPVPPPPITLSSPRATAAPVDVAISDAMLDRAFAETSVISRGSSRGVTAALVTT